MTYTKNSYKSKWVYPGYGIVFYGLGSCSFGNDLARNVVILSVDNSSSSYSHNDKNNCLVLSKGLTDDVNDSIGVAKEKFNISISKAKIKF